jgi:serine-type D-Ala-D-Ala carboxypeptidase/endopeptidase (penicillin-binding protein 4)
LEILVAARRGLFFISQRQADAKLGSRSAISSPGRATVYTQVIESSQTSGEPPPGPQCWGNQTPAANLNSPKIGGWGAEKVSSEVGTDLCVQGRAVGAKHLGPDRVQSWRHPNAAPTSHATLNNLIAAAVSWGLIGSSLWPSPTLAASNPAPICPAQLSAQLDAIADQPQFARAHWGIWVQTLKADPAQRQVLYGRNADRLFVPASNVKLLTTAAVLQRFGPQHKLRTVVMADRADPSNSTLRLIGHGDPSLQDAQLQALAQQLQRRGIRRVTQLILDESDYQGDPVNPAWDWGDVQSADGALPTALILNGNVIGLKLAPQTLGQPLKIVWDDPADGAGLTIENRSRTVAAPAPEFTEVTRNSAGVVEITGQLQLGSPPEPDAMATPNPTRYFADHLQRTWTALGISIGPLTVIHQHSPMPPGWTEVARLESPPLAELIKTTHQQSDNLYAETLLRALGAAPAAAATQTDSTLAAGLQQVSAQLTALGVDPAGYVLADGSGLSRRNGVSPVALGQTLQGMHAQPWGQVYRGSLPIGGVSGTLADRLADTAGRIQAKTGTLTGVTALSGYASGDLPVVFSVILNQSTAPKADQRRAIDAMARLLSRLQSCP